MERWLGRKLVQRHGVCVEAAGLLDQGTEEAKSAWDPIPIHCFPIRGPRALGYSPQLRNWIDRSDHDILHLHNLWMYTSVLALRWYQRTGRPYVISPHGMLDPWALRHSRWKKRLAGRLYENRMLRKASVIHAFHLKDLADIRAYWTSQSGRGHSEWSRASEWPFRSQRTTSKKNIVFGPFASQERLDGIGEGMESRASEAKAGVETRHCGMG